MAEQTVRTSAATETKAAIACRLRHKVGGRWKPSPTAGEVEIENVSADVIEIEWMMHPLQYLNLEITDVAGNLIPAPHYGRIFSPYSTSPRIFRLMPGEKYTHNVGLLGNVPEEQRLPGTYTVRAVYEYNGLKAVSEPLQVHIPSREANGEPA